PREACPCRPALARGRHRIEPRDSCPLRVVAGGLLRGASTNPDKRLSTHPASLGSTSCEWLARTLSRVVNSVYRATSTRLEDVRRTSAFLTTTELEWPCSALLPYVPGGITSKGSVSAIASDGS